MPGLRIAPAQVSSAEERLPRWLKLQIPEVWVRFLLAIAGLALAFGAAMFSTVSRESGNLWATLIFASMALLLATIVGLTTVPYLARRVAASHVRDAFDYDVTAVGIIYVLAVLLIGIAALNTGNNLLYIIVAAMLAAILISGIASVAVLRDLEVERGLPDMSSQVLRFPALFSCETAGAGCLPSQSVSWPSTRRRLHNTGNGCLRSFRSRPAVQQGGSGCKFPIAGYGVCRRFWLRQ